MLRGHPILSKKFFPSEFSYISSKRNIVEMEGRNVLYKWREVQRIVKEMNCMKQASKEMISPGWLAFLSLKDVIFFILWERSAEILKLDQVHLACRTL